MGGAADYLPAPFTDEEILTLMDSISLGRPISIKPLKVTAAFHIIYVLTYNSGIILQYLSAKALNDTITPASSTHDLILRIAGDHIPSIKTENEAAVISWLRTNTTVPVPDVIAYDATTSNPLNREFIILNRCPGVAISDIYDTLSQAQLDKILHQLIDILTELHAHPFTFIGGFVHSSTTRKIIAGPVLDETFWFLPDIKTFFSLTNTDQPETFTTLNITGPFTAYTAYTSAALKSHIHVAQIHPSLTFLLPYIPRLDAFLAVLPTYSETLNNTPIRLVHKDLHFANILYDPSTGLITSILDWEFAGTAPFPRWDPSRAFLWNGQPGEAALTEKYRLRDRFVKLCHGKKGLDFPVLKDAEFTSELQEKMHVVCNMMRCIVTMAPRGECLDRVAGWEADMVKGLEAFGV